MDNIKTNENDKSLAFLNSIESAATWDSMYRLLEGKQLKIFNNSLQAVNDPNYVGYSFINGPGGTEKKNGL